jgi:TolA-binding protein
MRIPSLVLFAVLAALPVTGTAPDRVDRITGGSLSGVTVVSENYKEVKVRTKAGTERSIPADQVIDIVHDDAPQAFRDGRSALTAGDPRNAISSLKLALATPGAPAWVPEYANFYLGEAQRLAGSPADAVPSYRKVLELKSDSRLAPLSMIGVARAQNAGGDGDAAIRTLDELIALVDAKGLSRVYALEAKRWKGVVFESQKRFSEAAGLFQTVAAEARELVADAKTPAELKGRFQKAEMEAEAARGAALVNANDLTVAESVYRGIATRFRDDPGAALLGRVGEAQVALARDDADRARVILVEVVATGVGAEDRMPEALLTLVRAYLALDAKGERGAKDTARRYANKLVRTHPGSDQAGEVRELLQ